MKISEKKRPTRTRKPETNKLEKQPKAYRGRRGRRRVGRVGESLRLIGKVAQV